MRRHHEALHIRRFRRIYNRAEDKFTFNINYETHTKVTPRSLVEFQCHEKSSEGSEQTSSAAS
jgi:hypothetical protein